MTNWKTEAIFPLMYLNLSTDIDRCFNELMSFIIKEPNQLTLISVTYPSSFHDKVFESCVCVKVHSQADSGHQFRTTQPPQWQQQKLKFFSTSCGPATALSTNPKSIMGTPSRWELHHAASKSWGNGANFSRVNEIREGVRIPESMATTLLASLHRTVLRWKTNVVL